MSEKVPSVPVSNPEPIDEGVKAEIPLEFLMVELKGKSIAELEVLKKQAEELLNTEGMRQDHASFLRDFIGEIDQELTKHELRTEPKLKREVGDEVMVTAIEQTLNNIPVGSILPEELVKHGNDLIVWIEWANAHKKPELVKALNARLQQVKRRAEHKKSAVKSKGVSEKTVEPIVLEEKLSDPEKSALLEEIETKTAQPVSDFKTENGLWGHRVWLETILKEPFLAESKNASLRLSLEARLAEVPILEKAMLVGIIERQLARPLNDDWLLDNLERRLQHAQNEVPELVPRIEARIKEVKEFLNDHKSPYAPEPQSQSQSQSQSESELAPTQENEEAEVRQLAPKESWIKRKWGKLFGSGDVAEEVPEGFTELESRYAERINPEDISDEEAADVVVGAVTKGMEPEVAAQAAEAVHRNWPSIVKEKVMGVPMKDIARSIFSKETAKSMGAGMVTGAAIKAGLQAAVGLSGFGLSVVGGAAAASGRKVLGAGWKEVGYWESRRALNRGDAGAILHRVKGQGLDRMNKLSPVDALKLIAERKMELEKSGISEGHDELLEIEKQVIEHGEKIGKLSGRERLDEYLRIASLAEDPGITKKKVEIERELALLSGRRFTKEQLAKAALWGALGGALGNLIFGGNGAAESDHVHHHTLAYNRAHIEGATSTNTSPISQLGKPDYQLASQALPSIVPHAPHYEIPPIHHTEISSVHESAPTHDVHEPSAIKAAFSKPIEHAHTLSGSEAPVTFESHEELDKVAKAMDLTLNEYKGIDLDHTTIKELYNSVGDASQNGDLVHEDLVIDQLSPRSEEFNMTVREFLESRMHEASGHVSEHTPVHVPGHEVVSGAHAAQVTASAPSEVSGAASKITALEGKPKFNLDLPENHTASVETVIPHAPHVEMPPIGQAEAPSAPTVAVGSIDTAAPSAPEAVDIFNHEIVRGPFTPNNPFVPQGSMSEITGRTLADMEVPKGMIPGTSAYDLISKSGPFNISDSLHMSNVPSLEYTMGINEGVVSAGEKSMFNWLTAAEIGAGALVAGGGLYGGYQLKKRMGENTEEEKKDTELTEEALKKIDAVYTQEDIKRLTDKEKRIKISRVMGKFLNKKEFATLEKLLVAQKPDYSKIFKTIENEVFSARKEGRHRDEDDMRIAHYAIGSLPGAFDAQRRSIEAINQRIIDEEREGATSAEDQYAPSVAGSVEAERFAIPREELKEIIVSLFPKSIKIKDLDIKAEGETLRLAGQFEGGITVGKIKIGGVIKNADTGLSIENLQIDARGYVKNQIQSNLSRLIPEMRSYFENKYGRPVSRINVGNQGLIIETAGSK